MPQEFDFMARTGWIGKPEKYKGLSLKFWKDVWGYYEVRIEGQGGYLGQINTYEKTKGEARKIAQDFVNTELISLQRKSRKQSEEHQRNLIRMHSH